MKTLSILINKPALEISCISENTYEYLYDYIDYKLQPYIKLGLFSYNIQQDPKTVLDGSDFPVQLINTLRKYTRSPHNSSNIFLCSEHLDFFNIQTSQFYLSINEFINIYEIPNNYCLFYTELYF